MSHHPPESTSRPDRSPAGLRERARRLGQRLSLPLPQLPWLAQARPSRSHSEPAILDTSAVARRLARPPLPLTSLVLLLLLLLPTWQLLRLPRPRAVGLEQLLSEASLLQSFPPTPERPVPALWRERLGPAQAESLWRRQRGPWWQLWGEHADAAPLLAVSAASLPGGPAAPLPANALRVGDLVVVAADPLSRQLLRDRLLPQQRLSRGLNRRCLERLRQDQAVLWNGTGLGVITGPVAPLLQRLTRGCLSFALADGGLVWQGEAGDADGLLTPLPSARRPGGEPLPPLPADRLLELEGGSTDLLLQGLLSRPLIRDPLSRRYGLDASRLALLRRTPFRLQLRALTQGPFQASLQLHLPVARQQRSWQALLDQLSRSLVEQGLSPVNAAHGLSSGTASPASAAPVPSAGAVPAAGAARSSHDAGATWKRTDGVIVGGWRWITRAPREPELLLFLGPVPTSPPIPATDESVSPLPAAGVLRMRSRPQALQALGLLPAELPELVRRSDQLWMVAEPPAGMNPDTPISLLSGGLRVPR